MDRGAWWTIAHGSKEHWARVTECSRTRSEPAYVEPEVLPLFASSG